MKKWSSLSVVLFFCTQIAFSQAISVKVEKYSPELDKLIDGNPSVEVIAEGLTWCEGPLWLDKEKMLLFSDIPTNSIYKWTPSGGKELFLSPSGYTGTVPRAGESGSNALLLGKTGRLLLCQHGDRRIAEMISSLSAPSPVFKTLADNYQGKKLNSPNDAVIDKKGNIFFTDPPYGLERNMDDPAKKLGFQGVYRTSSEGKTELLIDSISRPNGICILPKSRQLIISNSDTLKPCWYIYDIGKDGSLMNGRIFYNATGASKTEAGLPDGLKIDKKENIFATGPGGIWIFNREGSVLGKIKINDLVSNCSFSKDNYLYITANKRVIRVKLK